MKFLRNNGIIQLKNDLLYKISRNCLTQLFNLLQHIYLPDFLFENENNFPFSLQFI